MLKRTLHILTLSVLMVGLFACNSEKKVYDSDKGVSKKKKKKSGIALTKYGKLLKSNDSQAKFDAAKKYFDEKKYDKAIPLFEGLLNIYRGTSKSEEVTYYYAFSNYYVGDYIVAGYQFRTFIKNFPNSDRREVCAYTNAMCFYQHSPEYSTDQKNTYTAIEEFQRFINQYPKSEHVVDCNSYLDELRAKLSRKSYEQAILYYDLTDYKSAIVSFKNHKVDFSDTPHHEELDFLTVKSYYLLAVNSIESKKEERFKATIDTYLKFVDKYPNSGYLKEAEEIYSNALKKSKRNNKSTS